MKSVPLPMLPAKSFVFPILRPLMTMIKCLKAMARFDEKGPPPMVLRRECVSNAGFLAEALTKLGKVAGKTQGGEMAAGSKKLAAALGNQTWWNIPIDFGTVSALIRAVEAFSLQHKTAMGRAYRQNKQHYAELYKESVLKRKILIVHGPNDCPEVLCNTLSSGIWYEVDAMPVSEINERSARHHVTLLLCAKSREAIDYVNQCEKRGIDIFLSDLGRNLPVLDMNLCRLVNQARGKGLAFVTSPFVAMKLLPAIEEIYVRRLEQLDRSIARFENGIEMEEDALIKGIDEAVLYAELIVKSAWKKTAGFSMEQNLREEGA